MTVKELVIKLRGFDKNAQIVVYSSEDIFDAANMVKKDVFGNITIVSDYSQKGDKNDTWRS